MRRDLGFTAPSKAPDETIPINNLPYFDKRGRQVIATPVENIEVAKHILENDQS
jgi:hypothetical protein